jgi:hypothetical protein
MKEYMNQTNQITKELKKVNNVKLNKLHYLFLQYGMVFTLVILFHFSIGPYFYKFHNSFLELKEIHKFGKK